jgi:hypothetical protein
MFDIAADKSRNCENNNYENILWKNYNLKIEPIKKRYEIEIQRNRIERIEKIKEYIIGNNME